ncbi:hypothetical protein [Nitrobacter sp.]|uniref:hypothetical protein n=1 Tax=Nitrobacter sp. TaxID=29420 RepID=UPI0029CAAFCB|nr:hypothetical protein [Nitrobacter sp.]
MTFLVLLGAWQHLYFSWHVGEIVFFKNAYDEDSYALFSFLQTSVRLDRMLSTLLIKAIRATAGGSFDAGFIIADTILPALAFLASYFLTTRLFRKVEIRVFWALIILFAPDLFSLGNSLSITSDFLPLTSFKSLFGALGETLVPPIDTSYLNIFRTFEPQLAYVVGFTFAALLIRFTLGEAFTWSKVGFLAAAQFLLLLSYSIIGYPLLLLELYAALILLVVGSARKGFILVSLFVISLVIVVLSASVTLNNQNLTFSSRLPTISTSVLGSVLLCLLILLSLWRRKFEDRTLWLALGIAGMPLLLMNQQIVTGLMVSTKEWERYINHPLLAIGFAVFWSSFSAKQSNKWSRHAAIIASGAILVFAFDTSRRQLGAWMSTNTDSLAMARAINVASSRLSPNVRLILANPSLAPLIAVRRGGKRGFLVDYTDVFLDPVPSFDLTNFKVLEYGFRVFEYWKLSGTTPIDAERLLRKEAAGRTGYYSAFFFNICDYWYPCSDNRAVKTELIQQLIAVVINRYREFLSSATPEPSTRYLLVTTERDPGSFHHSFNPIPVASGSAGDTKAYVFEQKSKAAELK